MSGILGIDVSKAKLDVCLLRDDQRPAIKTFANTPNGFGQLVQWVQQRQVNELHACLEATGHYGEGVALSLHERGYTVSVVNPPLIADICRK